MLHLRTYLVYATALSRNVMTVGIVIVNVNVHYVLMQGGELGMLYGIREFDRFRG